MTATRENRVHQRLTFHEANILMENLRTQNKAEFMDRLANLSKHTPDSVLRYELNSLKVKLEELSEDEFALLRADVGKGAVLFPANYELP